MIISFQNAQAYPVEQNEWGITQSGFIILNRTQDTTQDRTQQYNKLTGKSQIVWTLEGTYYPYIRTYINITNITDTPIYLSNFASTQDASITVYPKTQLVQIVNNRASLILAFAVFMLTFFGIIISIIYEFKYKSTDINNYSYYEQEKTKTSNNKTNDTIINQDNVINIHQEEQYDEDATKGQ